MTDLIATLAARAAGRESPLSPVVGSLYEPAALPAWETPLLEEQLQEVLVRPEVARAPVAPGAPAAARTGVEVPQSQTLPRLEPPFRTADAAAAAPSQPGPPAASQMAEPAARRLRDAARPGALAAPRRLAGPPLDREDVPSERRVTDSAVHQAAAEPSRPEPAADGRASRGSAPVPAPAPPPAAGRRVWTPRVEPQPPRPPHRTAVRASGATPLPPARPQGAAQELDRASETVVNVTIGRIELRSIPGPAASVQPRARPPRPFPSLDEYLERTSEGRR